MLDLFDRCNTGGEPLVRKSFGSVLRRLGGRHEQEDLPISINGAQFGQMATKLREAGVTRVNVSLDLLRCERFAVFSWRGYLAQALFGTGHRSGQAGVLPRNKGVLDLKVLPERHHCEADQQVQVVGFMCMTDG